MTNILWMDNDRMYLMPIIRFLEHSGHKIERAYTVSRAEHILRNPQDVLDSGEKWSLILIDVMMNLKQEEVNDAYNAETTQKGRRTGLIFYIQNKDVIENGGASVAVLTMREDEEIQQEFESAGLVPERMMAKMDLADVAKFGEWIEGMIARRCNK